MLQIFPSKTGSPTATWNTIAVHSLYDPVKEAERFVREQNFSEDSLVILLEPGIGYIADIIGRRDDHPRLLLVFYNFDFYKLNFRKAPSWWPGVGESIEEFLSKNMDDDEISGLSVLEWAPSRRAFPETSQEINVRILQYIRERQGSLLTSVFFGKRWLNNCFRNFISIKSFLHPFSVNGLVVIAASGSSLIKSIPVLSEFRKKIFLIALPSSLEGLSAYGIYPDMIVLTDGGFYSSMHLSITRRKNEFKRSILAMPLSATVNIHWDGPILLMNQESVLEKRLLERAKLPFVRCPPNGTVAGSAYELIRRLSGFPVVFAGLDLCTYDIRSHIRPHAFDPIDRDVSCRYDPEYGRIFIKITRDFPVKDTVSGSRFSQTLRTYAGWFSALPTDRNRVLRLNPSDVDLDSMTPIENSDLVRILNELPEYEAPVLEKCFIPAEMRKKDSLEELRIWKSVLKDHSDISVKPFTDKISESLYGELKSFFGFRKNRDSMKRDGEITTAAAFFELLERDLELMQPAGENHE